MPTYKKHECTQCGRIHRAKGDICLHCQRKNEYEALLGESKGCALCGAQIPRSRIKITCYCSNECARAVGDARVKVASAVAEARRKGKLKPAKEFVCVDCGKPATDYDHRNYTKPLDVVPVCRGCNLRRGSTDDVSEFVAKHLNIPVSRLRETIVAKKCVANDVRVIDALGGTGKVAEMCGLTTGAVSQWRNNGMPKNWRMYFQTTNPELFLGNA
jgi:hypothetical protein